MIILIKRILSQRKFTYLCAHCSNKSMANFFRKVYLGIMKRLKFLPSPKYVGYYYEYYTGKKYKDENPTEFNEKIQWYKAHFRPQILNQLVDKYAVREYVKEKIGEEYLNECLGVYDKVGDIDFDTLPNKFVIKAVHGYGFNLIVPDKSKLNRAKAKLKMQKWMHRNQYFRGGQEWAYKDIKPRLVIEKYLDELGRGSITDYKFYCFGGKPEFVEVHLDREQNHKSGFFDLNFELLPFRDVPENKWIKSSQVEKPENFAQMIEVAEKLADKFPFVRVDMYSIRGQIIFGEMTFYPADGRDDFKPEKYNKILGDKFILPALPVNKTEIKNF